MYNKTGMQSCGFLLFVPQLTVDKDNEGNSANAQGNLV